LQWLTQSATRGFGKTGSENKRTGGAAIGIGSDLAATPSHTTGHTDRVSGDSVCAFSYAWTSRLVQMKPAVSYPNQMKKSQEIKNEQQNKQHLVGWILFVLCAVFFIASSIKNRDVLTLIGSIFFLVSCVFFIIPLIKKMKTPDDTIKSCNKSNSAEAKSREAD
jgi:hypothetical protein